LDARREGAMVVNGGAMTATAKVVVIDDDDSMRTALQRLLMAAGYGTVGYASAEAFLRDELDPGVDCVVCDQNLPAMSGLELLDALRTRRRDAVLILITALDSPGLGQRAMREGAAGLLIKPFAGSALIDVMRTAMATKSLRTLAFSAARP
jgi:FixJ family two-component response regulator